MNVDVREILDLDRHPVADPGEARDSVITSLREDLQRDGCAVLKGFVRPKTVEALVTECDRVAVHGHRNFNRTNAYFTQDRPDGDPALIRTLRLEPGDLQ
ncbi:MAG: hypothetical protein ABI434_18415, partial [Burkholderiaceae bacterium]